MDLFIVIKYHKNPNKDSDKALPVIMMDTDDHPIEFDRFDSAKVSFFLAIPALGAASLVGIYNVYEVGSEELNFLVIIAVIFSAIFSYITIALFLGFVKRFSLKIFVIYRIILSLIILTTVYL